MVGKPDDDKRRKLPAETRLARADAALFAFAFRFFGC